MADADRKRKESESRRLVTIPACKDKERRALLESDDIEWLMWYFAPESGTESPFTYQFTQQQIEMIAAIRSAIIDGGDQALAASRGEGKTTIMERMILKYTLAGVISFSVLFAATGSHAEDSLNSIKAELENNQRLYDDYPEACEPVRALENVPQKAHSQIVQGVRPDDGKPFDPVPHRFSWCGQEIFLPSIPGSPSAGSIIATRGLDSAVRGLKKKGRRVDLACIDDPDTEDTARSEEQADKLIKRIDRAIGGLGGQKRGIARVMITTLQSRISASYKFTDPLVKPSWKGRRFRFLISPPLKEELWMQYVAMQEEDWRKGTTFAHEFYVTNRDAMDEGAMVSNCNRYEQGELSALQHYFNQMARKGADFCATELDNDPPEESGPVESGITPIRIQKQLSGFDKYVVPPDCIKLTAGIDVGKYRLHWVVRAWKIDGSGFTIAHGYHQIYDVIIHSDQGMDVAIARALGELVNDLKSQDWRNEDGELRAIDLVLIDSGYRTDAVYGFCLSAGLGIQPVKGFGKSSECAGPNFSEALRTTKDKRVCGDRCFESRSIHQKKTFWLVCADTDHWKSWEHDRWITDPSLPGAMKIYGKHNDTPQILSQEEIDHAAYAHSVCGEVEVEEPHKGGIRRSWKRKKDNHWLDASYYSDVAASMLGIRLMGGTVRTDTRPRPQDRPSARDLANRGRKSA